MTRFYSGYQFAIIAGPLARFGDTAANAGILALCDGVVPVGFATMLASAGAAMWRMFTQPVSNAKTLLQTNGNSQIFMDKIASGGLITMWDGALGRWWAARWGGGGSAAATAGGGGKRGRPPGRLAACPPAVCDPILSNLPTNPPLGTMSSTWLGHYPWFLTYNTLEKYVPEDKFKGIMRLVRNAGLGFCASFVSDW